MEALICYSKTQGKVLFVEVSGDLFRVLEDLANCDVNLTPLLGTGGSRETAPFQRMLKAAPSARQKLSQDDVFEQLKPGPYLEAYIRRILKAAPVLSPITCPVYVTCATRDANILLRTSVVLEKPAKCPACAVLGSSPCTPAAVSFIPQFAAQKALDGKLPIFRCTNLQCHTFSNAREAPCVQCKAGVMGLSASLINTSGDVVPAAYATTGHSGLSGFFYQTYMPLVIHAAAQAQGVVVAGVSASTQISPSVDTSRPLYMCGLGAGHLLTNTPNELCKACGGAGRRAIWACTLVTAKEGGEKVEPDWHPWVENGAATSSGQIVLSDAMEVLRTGSAVDILNTLEQLKIKDNSDVGRMVQPIGAGELLAISKAGNVDDCVTVFTQAFASKIRSAIKGA